MLKRTHELLMEIERMKREHIEAIANRNGVWAQETQSTVRSQQKTIASLQETTARLVSELVILRGVVRPRVERDEPVEPRVLQPDVHVSDGPEGGMTPKQVQDAQEAYDRLMAELEGEVASAPPVDPAFVAAVTPSSKEEWDEEHQQ
jgi:hypothetical protein